ncbi:GntR family transcriptional regulator [Thermanaeromonas sp. C210]|nr:GntR family transcriptional regulator [Thermanaeromonas sp. C210]
MKPVADFDERRPIYLQIVELICRRVARGELPPGTRLPSLRDLSQELAVNPNTVQRAYQELERLGVAATRRGQGTFVAEVPDLVPRLRRELAARAADKYLQELQSLGLSPAEALRLLAERTKERDDDLARGGSTERK